ncbi:hypothetical protein M8C21_019262 [Ambrosia artemisiifolia]|uniref:BZIP domain-containing protein n=1 Tax=Ambrosia artemisiifolia TaxID=4212 RepID=A0AAD5BNF8_AMBAR|nr:hypothetical protein M8C21_019262 [Ambrosia artemisiifolia]
MDHFNHTNKKQQPFNHAAFITNTMFSEQDLDDFLNHADAHHRTHPPPGDMFLAADDGVFSTDDCKSFDLDVQYTNPDNLNRFSRCGGMTGNPPWSQNLNPKTVDSQSSICAESPTSDANPKRGDNNVVGATSDYEQSDDDDTEIEAGQCEQSNDQMDVKKHKRMVSNRESARRSRKRKQAHLTDMEKQVELLRVEHSDLFKQLTSASHQFKDASTNNRVLKSEVEALRAKVKLAEDMLARGSLTSSLSHLLENHLTTSQLFNCQNISRMGMGNVSPTVTMHGDDHVPHPVLPVPGQHVMVGLDSNPGIYDGNVKNGINSNGGSCASNIWSG